MADAQDYGKVVVDEFKKMVEGVKSDVKEIYNHPAEIKKAIEEQIRINQCNDMKNKSDQGGLPITQTQIDQCIAFVKGDMSHWFDDAKKIEDNPTMGK